MYFNNKFNKDNTIHFDVEEWSCTDPDEFQFCRKVNDTTFEYIQLKNEKIKNEFQHVSPKKFLFYINDNTTMNDWCEEEIDVCDYSPEEICGYLSAYGGILDNVNDDVLKNQLIAECIFETDVIIGETTL